MLGEITCANKVNGRVKERERERKREEVKPNLLFWFVFVAHFNYHFTNICGDFLWLRKIVYSNNANVLANAETMLLKLG